MGEVEFSLSIRGEPKDIEATIERVLKSSVESYGKNAAPEEEGEEMDWTVEDARLLLGKVTLWCRQVLEEMAKRPDGYRFTELREALDLTAAEVAGRLSSVGHNLKDFPGRPRPVTTDYRKEEYRLHLMFIEAINS